MKLLRRSDGIGHQSLPSGMSLRLRAEVALWRHGWIWPLCAALSGIALLLQWMFIEPARADLARVQKSMIEARAAVEAKHATPGGAQSDDARRLLQVEVVLRNAGLTDRQLSVILDSAARHSIELPRADYQTAIDADTGVSRTQVTFPLKASYPLLRGFVEDVLRQLPNTSVDRLSFKRDVVAQSQVEATLRLSLWSLPGPPTHPPVDGVAATRAKS